MACVNDVYKSRTKQLIEYCIPVLADCTLLSEALYFYCSLLGKCKECQQSTWQDLSAVCLHFLSFITCLFLVFILKNLMPWSPDLSSAVKCILGTQEFGELAKLQFYYWLVFAVTCADDVYKSRTKQLIQYCIPVLADCIPCSEALEQIDALGLGLKLLQMPSCVILVVTQQSPENF